MDSPDSSYVQQSEWQKHNLVLKSGTCSSRQKAELYLAYMSQIHYAWANSKISQASAAHLLKKYTDKYAAIVECNKEGIGLNCSDNVMALVNSSQNYHDKWRSSLTTSNVFDLRCVQEKFQTARAGQGSGVTSAQVLARNDNMVSTSGDSAFSSNVLSSSTHKQSELSLLKCKMQVRSSNFDQNRELQPVTGTKDCIAIDILPVVAHCSKEKPTTSMFGSNETKVSAKECTASGQYIFSSTSANVGKRKACYSIGEEEDEKQNSFIAHKQPLSKEPLGDCSIADETGFKTAKEQLWVDQQKKYNDHSHCNTNPATYGTGKKSLGAHSRGLHGKFVPPVKQNDGNDNCVVQQKAYGAGNCDANLTCYDHLKNIEAKMVELIMSEIMDHGPPLNWDDIAGLEFAKTTIKEIVVWPMLRPDIFTGLRGPPKGILLFGPPGTGKTLIGKCIACQAHATFFSISASSLTSKWVGEGEKMVRALFTVAKCHQPAVIFIDEIDSLLSQRGEGEHESSRRIKTEFLVQLDGATTSSDDRVLVVGATNRPQEIDEAARRRLVKRLYIPLPEASARMQIVVSLLSKEKCSLTEKEVEAIVLQSDGFSGSDMTQLCREAALGPIRSIPVMVIATITPEQVRPIAYVDFQNAFQTVRPSVSKKDLELYENWNKTFGCGR